MRSEPALKNAALVRVIQSSYELSLAELAFLPLGADAGSAVYRATTTGGEQYIVKGRRADWFQPASLVVPDWLVQNGVAGIVPPLVTRDRSLWTDGNDWIWCVFPWVKGRTASEVGLSAEQWYGLGRLLSRIHGSQLESGLAKMVPVERYRPSRHDVFLRLRAADLLASTDPLRRELGRVWQSHEGEIDELAERVEVLSVDLRAAPRRMVLCHADFHTWNLLVGPDNIVWLLDWDETTFAPKERDLMFVLGGIARGLVDGDQAGSFMEGYGQVDVDATALAYYRAAWALQDLAAYGQDVVFRPDLTEGVRASSLSAVTSLFDPGNIFSIALASQY